MNERQTRLVRRLAVGFSIFMWALFTLMFLGEINKYTETSPLNLQVRIDDTFTVLSRENGNVHIQFLSYCKFAVVGSTFHFDSKSAPAVIGWPGTRYIFDGEVPSGVPFSIKYPKTTEPCDFPDKSNALYVFLDEENAKFAHQGKIIDGIVCIIFPLVLQILLIIAFRSNNIFNRNHN